MSTKIPSKDRLPAVEDRLPDETTPAPRGPTSGFIERRSPSSPTTGSDRPEVKQPSGGPAMTADGFSAEVAAIRRQTGSISTTGIAFAELMNDSSIAQFPEDVRETWVKMLSEIVVEARHAVRNNSAVDFYIKLRQLHEEEDARPASQKLVFVLKFTDWLRAKGKFSVGTGQDSKWSIVSCTEQDMKSAVPKIKAQNDTTQEIKVFDLHQILAGIRFGG